MKGVPWTRFWAAYYVFPFFVFEIPMFSFNGADMEARFLLVLPEQRTIKLTIF